MRIKSIETKKGTYVMFKRHWWNRWRTYTDKDGIPKPFDGSVNKEEIRRIINLQGL